MNESFFASRNSEIRLFIILALALTLLIIVSFIFGNRTDRKDNSIPTEIVSEPFPEVEIRARAAYVYDVRAGAVLYAKNENTRLPLASLTKIMAALVAADLAPLSGTVTVPEEALALEGDQGLLESERWALADLIDFSLITSSNDGMRAVALSLGAISRAGAEPESLVDEFVVEMNNKARKLGLKNTYFWNETGLDETEIKGGAYGTAYDMAKLFEYALREYPELLKATRQSSTTITSLDNFSHSARNTNLVASRIPGLLISKTGLTDTAGGNLVVAFDPELGRPIIVSILASTEEDRFRDMLILVNAVMEDLQN